MNGCMEQFIYVSSGGTKFYYKDREMKIQHREDGPAIEWASSHKEWWVNGLRVTEVQFNRWRNQLKGECVFIRGNGLKNVKVDKYGDTYYYKYREMQILHREDGPAIEYFSGSKSWWIDGKRHRLDGPAVERVDGYKEWWIEGTQISEEEFKRRVAPCAGKVVVVDGVKYELKAI